jgi:TetR/AcrR family transcriptional repressor of nem operon
MSVGRPIEFDPAEALDAATRVFWRRGYEASSLEDLLAEMDISKSSFYQTFGGKSELFQRCLDSYRDASVDHLRAILERAPSGKAFLETTLGGVAERVNDPMGRAGCLLVNTASEFAQQDPQIAILVTKALAQIEDLFYAAVCRSQAEGDIPKSADARSLALFLMTNLGGLRGMARAGASPDKIRAVVKVIMNSLK